MTEHDLTLARAFRFHGGDTDFWYFSTPSFTRAGVRHDLWIDKRTGEIGCYCEDSICRHKRGHVLDRVPTGCKHERILGGMVKTK